ncbi:MAG: hypothetical protein CNE95_01035 [Puniceicoccaceae bacterium MED-G30]|nr:MAG: hypothetical protein CNE95_01035 [Puniceicoccaceae bacterium MED-G30]
MHILASNGSTAIRPRHPFYEKLEASVRKLFWGNRTGHSEIWQNNAPRFFLIILSKNLSFVRLRATLLLPVFSSFESAKSAAPLKSSLN